MRLRPRPLLLLPLLLGCGNLGEGDDGVVALEVLLPNPAVVEPGDTVQLRARALNANGDSVAASIVWLSPDNTISVDSSGRLSTDATTGTGRVQAKVGGLRSNLETFAIRRRSDTLALTDPLAVTVPSTDSASASLVARVLSITPDTQGIGGTAIVYQVVDSTALRNVVHFAGGTMNLRATTGGDGAPAVGVTLRRQSGATFPVTVQVQVSATRPSGATVPGSGRTFDVTFE
ncbi:MAG TPA: hypothetical protein VG817_10875 [Gemmatimonadales bacterium]|nr:hypothetical protein [Gemmatimonadales bacterium]